MNAQPSAAPTHKINGKVWTEMGRSAALRPDGRALTTVVLCGPRGACADLLHVEGTPTARLLVFGRRGLVSNRVCAPI